jgi:hypothetical protein
MPPLAGLIPNRKFALLEIHVTAFWGGLNFGVFRTDNAGDPIEYAGIDVLILQHTTKLIKKAYSEWNNGELLYDLGERVCFQKGNASACS